MRHLLERLEFRTLISEAQALAVLKDLPSLGDVKVCVSEAQIVTSYFDNQNLDLLHSGAQLRLRRKGHACELSFVVCVDMKEGLETEFIVDTISVAEAQEINRSGKLIVHDTQLLEEINQIADGPFNFQGSLTTVRKICDGRKAKQSFIWKVDANYFMNGGRDFELKMSAVKGKQEEAEAMFFALCDLQVIQPTPVNSENKYRRMMCMSKNRKA